MLIVCMMLNQTNYKQVDKVRETFFDKFPEPDILINALDKEIIEVIKPLGFYNRRCKLFKKFSEEFIKGNWKSVDELSGVGKYASDSWKLFQEGNIEIEVEDKELKKYKQWCKTMSINNSF